MASTAHRTLQSVPTYKKTRPAFRSRSASRRVPIGSLPLPASFGSCPPYRGTRRSTDPYKDTRSAQRTGQADGIGPGTSSPHRHFDHALDLPIDESLLYRTRTAARAACPRPPPACPVPASHSLTFSTASLSSMRFPAMRSVQAYTRDALQLHRPDLGEGHVDPS